MVGYSLAGRRRCRIFEFRCKKKPRLFKIENNQQRKTIAAVKIILKTNFDLAILGGGGAPSPLNPSMKPSSADCGSFEGSSADSGS